MLNLCKFCRLQKRFRETTYRKRLRVENFTEKTDFSSKNRI